MAIKRMWWIFQAHLVSPQAWTSHFSSRVYTSFRDQEPCLYLFERFPSLFPYIISTWWWNYQMIFESVDCVTINHFICKTIYASALNNFHSFLLKITACFIGISINTSNFTMLLPVNNQCGFYTIEHGYTYVSCTIGLDLPRSVIDECVECPFSRVKHLVLAPIFRPAPCSAQKWNVLDLLG